MLNFEIKNGPLTEKEYEEIWSCYVSLTDTKLSKNNLLKWLRDNPYGKAIHTLLRTEDLKIVGHCAVFPFRVYIDSIPKLVGKVEYYFLLPEFRNLPIKNRINQMNALILLKELYNKAVEKWDPLIISAPKDVMTLHKMVGCKIIHFKLFECLWILKPYRAAVNTQNISLFNRYLFAFIGFLQNFLRPFHFFYFKYILENKDNYEACIKLSQNEKDLKWRFNKDEYTHFRENCTNVYMKNGSLEKFLRVHQTNLSSLNLTHFINESLKVAKNQNALGFRWALYYNSDLPVLLIVNHLLKMGFICAKRTRSILIFSKNKKSHLISSWDMSDFYIGFDS